MSDRIEICGAIAAGKTTFANTFAKIDYHVLLEDFTKVAVLDDFYLEPTRFAFETEISFTLQHYYQMKKAIELNKTIISDFSFVDDYAFALVTLDEDEMKIYSQVFEYILESIGKPQKLIFLSAPVDILLSRIKKRGRDNEQGISAEYLFKFLKALQKSVEIYKNGVQIININTDKTLLSEYNRNLYRKIGILRDS